jgi:hypothetical protein
MYCRLLRPRILGNICEIQIGVHLSPRPVYRFESKALILTMATNLLPRISGYVVIIVGSGSDESIYCILTSRNYK